MPHVSPVFLAVAALALGAGGFAGVTAGGVTAGGARAGSATLCGYQAAPVDDGRYTVENDEWDSSSPECVTTDHRAEFQVASSAISNPADGAPGGYPSIFAGCHWGDCTQGGLAAQPLLLARLRAGMVTSSWYTTGPGGSGGIYDAAYDIWINRQPTTTGAPDGSEIMVWISHHGPVRPAGSLVAAGVRIGGHRFDVWYSPGSGRPGIVSYEMAGPHTSVTGLDIAAIISNAERRGYASPSWHLISVEAGFEIWRGGKGLATRLFSVSLKVNPRGWSS